MNFVETMISYEKWIGIADFGNMIIFHTELVGGDWNMTLIFPDTVYAIIIPTDSYIFRGVGIPRTSISWLIKCINHDSLSDLCKNL